MGHIGHGWGLHWVQSLRTEWGIATCQYALVSAWHPVDELGKMDERSRESQARIRDDVVEEMFGLDYY